MFPLFSKKIKQTEEPTEPVEVVPDYQLMIRINEPEFAVKAHNLLSAYDTKENAFTKKRKEKLGDIFGESCIEFNKEVLEKFPWITSWTLHFYRDGSKYIPFIVVNKNKVNYEFQGFNIEVEK